MVNIFCMYIYNLLDKLFIFWHFILHIAVLETKI